MPFTGDTFSHLFDWEKDPQRQEKIINARLEAEFDGIDTALTTVSTDLSTLEAVTRREVLTAARTYYVRTDGSDSNTGLADSAGGAFLTIQKAIDITAGLDVSIYSVTIQVRTGAFNQVLTLKDPVSSGGAVILQGDTTTPANVTIDVAGACITSNGQRLYTVRGFSLLTSVANYEILATNHSFLKLGNNTYRSSSFAHIGSINNSTVEIGANYTISGGAGYHWYSEGGGAITCQGRTITVSGTPAFSAWFVSCIRGSLITANSNTFSGSATGARYNVTTGGLIETGGGGANYFPGNAAGTGTNYGASPYGLYN